MTDKMQNIMTELDGILDVVKTKANYYQHSNLVHNSIEELDIIIATIDNDFTEMNNRLTEFHDHLNDAFLEVASEIETE